MIEKRHGPIAITQRFYQLGIPSFPAYLSMGDDGMIIEGGTGATFDIIVDQIKQLGIAPERIQYLALTHTHYDHIGAVLYLKRLWPHLKVIGGSAAVKSFKRLSEKKEALQDFLETDSNITKILLSKGEIAEVSPKLDSYIFKVDRVLEEEDSIDLGAGIVWTIHNTPGHSPCHISLNNKKEGTLVISDATGFYVPEKDVFWPNYFESLETYCDSIRKLSNLPAQRLILGHNGIVEGEVSNYFQKAMRATESYHFDIMERLQKNEDQEAIALEKAKWVNGLTDIQTFEVILGLTKLLMARSQSAPVNDSLFTIP